MFQPGRWEKEWKTLEKREARFLNGKKERGHFSIDAMQKKLSEKVPDKLEGTLNKAFARAFELVFRKGTGIIEKTYKKEDYETAYKVNEYAASISTRRKHAKAFSKKAGLSRTKNLLISGVEGAGLGLLGIGIPDIVLFTAVLLKSIYEIALSYGFSYESEEEQCFILYMIQTSLLSGEELRNADGELNAWIDTGRAPDLDRAGLIGEAAGALSEALLYMKFLQGIPIIGVAGGLADAVYLKKITDYVELKYRRRFLKNVIKSQKNN